MELQDNVFVMEELEEWQQIIRQFLPDQQVDIRAIFQMLLGGDLFGAVRTLTEGYADMILAWIHAQKKLLLWLVLISVFSAILGYLVEIFKQDQVAEIAFYFVYLLLTGVLFSGFQNSLSIADVTLNEVHLFGRLLGPSFLLTYSLSGSAVRGTCIRLLIILLLEIVEKILIGLVLPAIHIYMVLSLMSCLWPQDRFSGLLNLTGKFVNLVLKTVLGVVTSAGILQNLLASSVDQASRKTLQSAVSMIPGIGDVSDGTLKLLMGCANLIKSSMGILFLLLLFVICLGPVAKLFVSAAVLKLSAALMEILGDKRMVQLTNRTGEALLLLCKTTLSALFFFMITIAVACSVAGGE